MQITRHIRPLIVILLFCFFTSYSQKNQCDTDGLLKKNIAALEDFTFIKAFPIDISKGEEKTTYNYVLSRNTGYRIVVCGDGKKGGKMIINLYGSEKKALASNYDKRKKEFSRTLDFSCSSTGTYRIEAYFEDNQQGCGLNVLGFKKTE